jgi:hypothetical protein
MRGSESGLTRSVARDGRPRCWTRSALGGNLYGRIAIHPALAGIGEKSERGRVMNRAWRRYGWVNSAAPLAIVAGWAGARVNEARPRSLSPPERALGQGKDAAVAAVAVTGVATALTGVQFARSAPDGAVPPEDGNTPAPETPADAARLKRRLNALGTGNVAAVLSLVGMNAAAARTKRQLAGVEGRLRSEVDATAREAAEGTARRRAVSLSQARHRPYSGGLEGARARPGRRCSCRIALSVAGRQSWADSVKGCVCRWEARGSTLGLPRPFEGGLTR